MRPVVFDDSLETVKNGGKYWLSKIWVKTPSFEDGFKLKWKKR